MIRVGPWPPRVLLVVRITRVRIRIRVRERVRVRVRVTLADLSNVWFS